MPLEKADEAVATAVLEWFHANVPEKKHAANEYTVLSGLVVYREGTNDDNHRVHVLSIGTGTKCLGRSQLCPDGLLIHDAHAEAMCRRGFLRYLYLELQHRHQQGYFVPPSNTSTIDETSKSSHVSLSGPEVSKSIFEWHPEDNRLHLKTDCSLYLYVSEAPCGDAALYDMKDDVIEDIRVEKLKELKRRKLNRDDDPVVVPCRSTGAKATMESNMNKGAGEYSTTTTSMMLGVARIKSGRSDILEANQTLSMSCSDKICRWIHCGLQGSLLAHWFAPVGTS
jgi:tRNA-specific adenosine deaminase 1